MREIKPLITGVWQYGGNVHIAYRHIVKHQNVITNAKRHAHRQLLRF